MLTLIIILVFLGMAAFAFYSTFLSPHHHVSERSSVPTEQPTHFDLLDDNGDPIQSSDDRTRSSDSVVSDDTTHSLRYFCIKDKGYHVSVWPKNQGIQGLDYIEFNIAGITNGENVEENLGEFAATLEPDPHNPYDPQAIKILTSNGDRIGYVPKDWTDEVRNFTSLPCTCYCYIGQHDGTYFTDCYISHDNP